MMETIPCYHCEWGNLATAVACARCGARLADAPAAYGTPPPYGYGDQAYYGEQPGYGEPGYVDPAGYGEQGYADQAGYGEPGYAAADAHQADGDGGGDAGADALGENEQARFDVHDGMLRRTSVFVSPQFGKAAVHF